MASNFSLIIGKPPFSYGFSMVFLWISHGTPGHQVMAKKRHKILAGDRKWKGPWQGLVFMCLGDQLATASQVVDVTPR